jgi:hypothetical protein
VFDEVYLLPSGDIAAVHGAKTVPIGEPLRLRRITEPDRVSTEFGSAIVVGAKAADAADAAADRQ